MWFVYRGDGANVVFDPPQFKIYPDYRLKATRRGRPSGRPAAASGRQVSRRRDVQAPGTYVIRVMAHDGGLSSAQDVTVTVAQ